MCVYVCMCVCLCACACLRGDALRLHLHPDAGRGYATIIHPRSLRKSEAVGLKPEDDLHEDIACALDTVELV